MNNDSKIPQQKYYERERFTTEEKYAILRKSKGKCSHCGREIYIGCQTTSDRTMTVDHFIPLFKGGSNRELNLVALCMDCNKEKDDKLYPIDYLAYLNNSAKDKLNNYFQSYIQVTDYIQRHRLLLYDEYDLNVLMPTGNTRRPHKHSKKGPSGVKVPYKLKLATWDDYDKLCEYLIKYLKKFNSLENEESARENISFWLRFGCIYYVEKDHDITLMAAITIKHLTEIDDFRGINNQPYMYIFSYYNTDLSLNILMATMYDIPDYIMKENNLTFTPINIIFLKKDSKVKLLANLYNADFLDDCVSSFCALHMIVGNETGQNSDSLSYDDMSDEEKKVYNFYKQFDDVTNTLISYFNEYSFREDISWMLNCLFSPELIQEVDELAKLIDFSEYPDRETVESSDESEEN